MSLVVHVVELLEVPRFKMINVPVLAAVYCPASERIPCRDSASMIVAAYKSVFLMPIRGPRQNWMSACPMLCIECGMGLCAADLSVYLNLDEWHERERSCSRVGA